MSGLGGEGAVQCSGSGVLSSLGSEAACLESGRVGEPLGITPGTIQQVSLCLVRAPCTSTDVTKSCFYGRDPLLVAQRDQFDHAVSPSKRFTPKT